VRTGLKLLALAILFGGFAGPASADNIVTFDVSGKAGPADYTTVFGGTISINVTNGTVASADITLSNSGPALTQAFSICALSICSIDVSDGLFPALDIILPVSSLENYAGGNACSSADNSGSCLFVSSTYDYFEGVNSLTLTDPPAAPEPASYIMLFAGLIGLAALRKARAVPTEA
jgi:hypothetical protein